jgi:hypothetical protein
MTKTKRNLTVLAVLVTIGLVGALPAAAQTTVEVTASWTPPQGGSPVHHYILQLSTDGGPFTTVGSVTGTSYVLDLEVGQTYVARVAGVDDQGRQGPFSEDSDPYTPDVGPPGQPGKPIIM